MDAETLDGNQEQGGSITIEPGTLIAERYQVRGLIGEGGMGSVFRVHDLRLKSDVAMKLLRFNSDVRGAARFKREQLVSATLRHRNIARVLDVGESSYGPFLVMDLAERGSLVKRVLGEGPLDDRNVADLARGICQAVKEAHARGIVHRDIKPANILLEADDWPLLADFGLAKELDDQSGMSAEGIGLGTKDYSAPEQLRDAARSTERSDIYSIGATLYFALTGRSPQEREFSSIPLRWRSLIQSCLSINPDNRPSSAQILLLLVERISEEIAEQMVPAVGMEEYPDPEGSDSNPGSSSLLNRRFQIVRDLDPLDPGKVFIAQDLYMAGKEVVVKRLPRAEEDPGVREFLEDPDNAKRILDLDHPNIRGIISRHLDANGPYVVMPYILGKNLAEIIQDSGPLSGEQFFRIARGACLALEYGHSRWLVHRNLKPTKVLVDGEGNVKITDFGLVCGGDRESEGSLGYASPEERNPAIQGASHLADIYRLGAVFHFALTGKSPRSFPRVRVPSPWADVVQTCLEEDPRNRLISAKAVLSALESCWEESATGGSDRIRVEKGSGPSADHGKFHCPNCQVINPEDGIYCINCGERMQAICPNPSCRKLVPIDGTYCHHCGNNIPQWRVATLFLEKAKEYGRERRFFIALQTLGKALKKAPNREDLLSMKNDIEKEFQRARQSISLARVAEGLGHWESALDNWKHALEIVIDDPEIRKGIQSCRAKCRKAKYSELRHSFQEALSAFEFDRAEELLGELAAQGDLGADIQNLRNELEKGRRKGTLVYFRRGLREVDKGNIPGAEDALKLLKRAGSYGSREFEELQAKIHVLLARRQSRHRLRKVLSILGFIIFLSALVFFAEPSIQRWQFGKVVRAIIDDTSGGQLENAHDATFIANKERLCLRNQDELLWKRLASLPESRFELGSWLKENSKDIFSDRKGAIMEKRLHESLNLEIENIKKRISDMAIVSGLDDTTLRRYRFLPLFRIFESRTADSGESEGGYGFILPLKGPGEYLQLSLRNGVGDDQGWSTLSPISSELKDPWVLFELPSPWAEDRSLWNQTIELQLSLPGATREDGTIIAGLHPMAGDRALLFRKDIQFWSKYCAITASTPGSIEPAGLTPSVRRNNPEAIQELLSGLH